MTSFAAGQTLTAAMLNLRPYVHAYQTVSQNLTNITPAPITFTNELIDSISGHSITTNTSRYTPNVAGWYESHGAVVVAASATGMLVAQFRKNGALVTGSPYEADLSSNQAFAFNAATMASTIYCNGSSDFIELWANQNSGGTVATAINATEGGSFMICRWVSP